MKDQIVLDNLLINYYCFNGQGKQTIIFLHGWKSESKIWQNVAERLGEETGKIYALDLPGFGLSPLPSKAFTVSDYVDIVEKFIAKLELKNVILVGHSFGGRVAIKLAAKKPDYLSKLVLVDSAGLKIDHTAMKTKNILARIAKPFFKPKFMSQAREVIYRKIGAADYVSDPKLQKTYLNIIGEDLKIYLKDINVPTLVIWGENDSATPVEMGKIINNSINNSKIVILKNADHFSFIDQPQEFTNALIEFTKS